MNAITISIVTAVMVVITLALLLVDLHYNNQLNQCEFDPLLWCYTDWKCQYGMKDSYGGLVGTGEDGVIPMSCYLRGMYGKLTPTDQECGMYFTKYNKAKDKCFPTETTTPVCDESPTTATGVQDLYPCTCDAITNGNYGNNYLTKTGFYLPLRKDANGSENTNSCEANSPGSTPDPREGCWSISEIICNQLGKQLGACQTPS